MTAGTDDYTLDTAILLVKEAFSTAAGENGRLTQVSPSELLEMRMAGGTATSGAAMYYAVNGANLFMVYPTPASSADTVTFYYVPRPTTLASGADIPSEIPAEHHPAIEFYALWRLASYDDDQSSGQGERYREQYSEWVRKARKYISMKGNVRLPRATVGRRRLVPHDPSADWR